MTIVQLASQSSIDGPLTYPRFDERSLTHGVGTRASLDLVVAAYQSIREGHPRLSLTAAVTVSGTGNTGEGRDSGLTAAGELCSRRKR